MCYTKYFSRRECYCYDNYLITTVPLNSFTVLRGNVYISSNTVHRMDMRLLQAMGILFLIIVIIAVVKVTVYLLPLIIVMGLVIHIFKKQSVNVNIKLFYVIVQVTSIIFMVTSKMYVPRCIFWNLTNTPSL